MRSFRFEFHHENDLNQCLKVLADYFPIDVYSEENLDQKIQSTRPDQIQTNFFQAIKDTALVEHVSTMTFRTDFIRQYLSSCLMDPAFFTLVNKNEELLKNIISD